MALDARLRVGDSSTYDVSLTSSGVALLNIPWIGPDINQAPLQSLGDGNSLSVPSFSNVTESIDIHISDSTAALVAAKVQSIERLLDLARQGTLGYLDDKLYLRVQFDHDSLVWRSQILAAKLELPEGSNQIWRKFVKATLIITRRFYWETEAMQAVEVSSNATAATTGYATITNNDNTNYFSVAAAQVTGSLPAPAKIYIKNVSGASRAFGTAYIGNYVFNDPSNVFPIFSGGSANFSDTTPGPTSTEAWIYTWELDGGIVDDFAGQMGRFVVVWSDRPAIDNLIRAAVGFGSPYPDVDLALGEQMLNTSSDYVSDLGALPIPPGGYVSGMGTAMYARILSLPAAGGSDTLGINWLQIFPTGSGRFRALKGVYSMTISSNNEVVDDGPNGTSYVLASGVPLPIIRPLYTPIYLWPGRINRMRMIVSGGTSMETTGTWGIKCEFRPRRMSF